MFHLKIATRDSPLALRQTELVIEKIISFNSKINCQMVKIKSHGDMASYLQDHPFDIGIFVKKLEQALLSNKADIAIHSLKDMPTEIHSKLELVAVLRRETYRDVFVFLKKKMNLFEEKKGRLGTSSIRRAFFITKKFPDFKVVKVRGNVNSRIEKLRRNECDFLVLSKVSLLRLNLNHDDLTIVDVPLSWLLPAPAQGVIALETLKRNSGLNHWLRSVNDLETRECVNMEREIMRSLECGCNSPIGCLVKREKGCYWVQLDFVPNFESDEKAWEKFKILNIRQKVPDNGRELFLNSLKNLVRMKRV